MVVNEDSNEIIQALVSKKDFLKSQDSKLVETIIDDVVKNIFGNKSWEERESIKDNIREAIIADG